MKFDLKDIPAKFAPVARFLKRYMGTLFVVILVGTCAFLVFRISTYVNQEPSDDDVASKLQGVTRPKIDKATLDKIQELQDQNVQVQTLFKDARNNPFNE
ncbi:MAG TPA: hypothetical protein VLF87_03790 [Patescibacteria group bacterium]|nr:hypothetical protein [Candidatus Saccharimonadales bacterium]HSX47080.1 hypothetical protein [Patescibacteria group bacterium]